MVLVEGVSMIKRHTRPNPSKQIKGGIAEKESHIAISNVMVLTSGGQPTRVGYRVEGTGTSAHRVRIAKKTGEPLEKRA
jgi:large subunit ribosomal protein L24